MLNKNEIEIEKSKLSLKPLVCSVMQSDQNSFRGNVVLGTVNMAFRVDNSILYQIYKKLIYIMMSFNFLNVILTLLGSTQTQYFEFLVEG